jgi:hypothetical protein
MEGPQHVSEFFKVTVGSVALDGMDYWRLDEEGLIQEMTVLWRPLPAILAVQNQLTMMDETRTDGECVGDK